MHAWCEEASNDFPRDVGSPASRERVLMKSWRKADARSLSIEDFVSENFSPPPDLRLPEKTDRVASRNRERGRNAETSPNASR